MPISYNHDHDNEITMFGATNFRDKMRRFGIKTDDRRRHMYVIGKTGTGKTTLMENMMMSDILAGHGCCYIDPHGDTAEKILDFIPSNRINDVVYFNPADLEYPSGFNILETTNEGQKHLVASGLMGVFKKIWPDVWSARMEYILLNCVLALLDYPGATLLGISRLLVDKEYRERVISKIRNPIVKTFWVAEFTSWSEKYATEAIAPVQNKVGQFLSASIIRNIVAQVKSSINPRQIMDEGKIFIVNLSKGKIGEDNMRLLGGMIITKIQLAAMERVDIKNEDDRRDFYLYVDEFQNFANESFVSILSEARKYRLNLTIAHQYIGQLEEEVAHAAFGNVGTLVVMRVGAEDAQFMETEFMPTFTPEDLVNLPKYHMYLKLMVDGVTTNAFSAVTLPPIAQRTGSEPKVIAVSRERYAEQRAVIEEKVLRWSGMESGPIEEESKISYPQILTEEEREKFGINESVTRPPEPSGGLVARSGGDVAADAEEHASVEYLRISPERLSAISKPPQPGKKEKPKFPHTCSRCGKIWEMPIQLDPTRPMYCAECLPLIREERKSKKDFAETALRPEGSGGGGSVRISAESSVPDASAQKIENLFEPRKEARPPERENRDASPKKKRHRGGKKGHGEGGSDMRPLNASAPRGTITVIRSDEPKKPEPTLSQELEQGRGRPIDKNKRNAEPHPARPTPLPVAAPPSERPAPPSVLDPSQTPKSERSVPAQKTDSDPSSKPKTLKPGEKIKFWV